MQAVLVENTSLKAEIRKLRIENSELMKRVRFADTNAKYMRVSSILLSIIICVSSKAAVNIVGYYP